ncbi:hypothetical protein FOA52_010910 [Chlamydomonas sp. UWO 241]|nr:hypothetical protein FOA52_010910 [Chlamydomonas sp. UWO 241]
MPTGLLLAGEDFADAVEREVQEETEDEIEAATWLPMSEYMEQDTFQAPLYALMSKMMAAYASGEYKGLTSVLVSGPGPSARYAHTLSLVANRFLVAMGGNDGKGSQLLDDLLVADDSNGTELTIFDPRAQPWVDWMDAMHGKAGASHILAKAAQEEAAAALALTAGSGVGSMREMGEQIGSIERAARVGREAEGSPDLSLHRGMHAHSPGSGQATPDVRLWHRAVVVHQENSLRGLVRQGSHKRMIDELLRPRTWKAPEDRAFFLSAQDIGELCDNAERIFRDEPTVLDLHAPIKIFGDLHGQFGDLMRLFEEYGTPSTAGDITYIDYLFLGDYVDRGSHSLETICLLLALKIEHPRNIHLIRGNHEAHDINALFGFRLECLERLGDDAGVWVWRRINDLFNYLPLAASIESKILCMHGGIGRSIHKIDQIAAIQRPVTMEDGGPNNGLQMIVRAHECVMDGFERFASGHLITLFSATNYCGTAGNAGAILVLGRDLVMVPKLIHPLPPSEPRTPDSQGNVDDDTANMNDTWMQSINDERPPTPPRGRPHLPGSSLEYF